MKLAIVTLACATQLPFGARPQSQTSKKCDLTVDSDCMNGCNLFAGGIAKCKDHHRTVYFDFDGTIEQKDALAHHVFAEIEKNTKKCHEGKTPTDKKECASMTHKAFSVTKTNTVSNGCADAPHCYPSVDDAWLANTSKSIEVAGKTETMLVGTEIMLSALEVVRKASGNFVEKYFEQDDPAGKFSGKGRVKMMREEVEKLKKTTEVNVLSASWAPIPGAVWRQYLGEVTKKDLNIAFNNIYGIDDPGGSAASNKGAVVADQAKKHPDSKPIECAVHVDNSFKYARQVLALGGGGVAVVKNMGITKETFELLLGTDWKADGSYKTGDTCIAEGP